MRSAPNGAGTWNAIIASVAHAFTRPSFAIFADLMAGWVCTPGRRTITRIIGVDDPEHRRAHDAYHRFLRDGVWEMGELWRVLTVTIVERLIAADVAVVPDLDDTVHHKTGRRIEGAGIFRDAVRSTRNRVVYGLGLNLVVITIRVRPPWGGMPFGLPINIRIRHKTQGPSIVEHARLMLIEIASWLPERHFQLAADGAYAQLCGAGLERIHITSRLRRDAAVYELTPPPTGRRGRPRKKGERLPALAAMAATATGWATVTYDQRGTDIVRQVWSRTLLWYHVAKDRPLLLVVVRDPDGHEPDDYFITTDTAAKAAGVACHYTGRWSIEVTFRDEKQHLGGEDPQCWKRLGPERAAYLSLWLHAVVWLWYLQVWGPAAPGPRPPGTGTRPAPRPLTRWPHSAPACGNSELHRCVPPGRSHPKFVTNSSTCSPEQPDNRALQPLKRTIPAPHRPTRHPAGQPACPSKLRTPHPQLPGIARSALLRRQSIVQASPIVPSSPAAITP